MTNRPCFLPPQLYILMQHAKASETSAGNLRWAKSRESYCRIAREFSQRFESLALAVISPPKITEFGPRRRCVLCTAIRIARLAFVGVVFVPRGPAEWPTRVDCVRWTLAIGDLAHLSKSSLGAYVFPVQKTTTEQTRSSFGGVQQFLGEHVLRYVFLPPYVLHPPKSRPKEGVLDQSGPRWSRYHSISKLIADRHFHNFLWAINFKWQIQNCAARGMNCHYRDRSVGISAESLSVQIQILSWIPSISITDTDFRLEPN